MPTQRSSSVRSHHSSVSWWHVLTSLLARRSLPHTWILSSPHWNVNNYCQLAGKTVIKSLFETQSLLISGVLKLRSSLLYALDALKDAFIYYFLILFVVVVVRFLTNFITLWREWMIFSMKNKKECRGLFPRQGTKLGTEVIYKRVG